MASAQPYGGDESSFHGGYRLMFIVFIESNTTGTGYLLAELAVAQGYDVLVLTQNEAKYQFPPHIAVESIDTSDQAVLSERLDKLQQVDRIAAVMSTSEYFIATAAKLAEQFGLPGTHPGAVELCRDKYRLRQTLQDRVEFPVDCRLVTSELDIPNTVTQLNYPLVIKPRSGSGSCSVSLCQNLDDVKKAIADNREFVQQSGRHFADIGCLAEFYVSGQEYSVECFHGKAVCLTRKHLGGAPYFVETGHDVNFAIDTASYHNILTQVEAMLAAINLDWGPAHVEIKVSQSKVYLIEINPRLAGGMIPVLIRETLGVDLLQAWLTAALGGNPELAPTGNGQGAIRFFVPQSDQVVTQPLTDGLLKDCARRADLPPQAIKDAKLYKPMGYRSQTRGDFTDRVGHVLVVAPQLLFQQVDVLQNAILREVMCD